jgi:hypothetical protein
MIRQFARLRWRLLRGSIRSAGQQRWSVIVGIISAAVVGLMFGVALAAAGQKPATASDTYVVLFTALAFGVVAIGVVVGLTQPVDPRVLATEPLSQGQLGAGLLVAAAAGPPGLSAGLVGAGALVGGVRSAVGLVVSLLAVSGLLASLLLLSRSTMNLLGLLAVRLPRAGQLVVALTSFGAYGAFQIVPWVVFDMTSRERRSLAGVLQHAPPGQFARAIWQADDSVLSAVGHVALGALWLGPLAWAFVITTQRLLHSVKQVDSSSKGRTRARRLSPLFQRMCGSGPVGAIAWRSLRTRMRTPRSALETFTGASLGLAAVLVPALIRDNAGPGTVLAGGAVQFAVLFMSGNSWGSDGPALSSELLTGAEPRHLVAGKMRSMVIAAAPLAVVGPVVAAAVTDSWAYVPAGWMVGAGALGLGAAAAMAQSTLVPIAIPESDNPLASGDTGRGCVAGLIVGALLVCLAIVSLPVAVGLFVAVSRESAPLALVMGVCSAAVGWFAFGVGVKLAAARWRQREPELYAAVIPAR